MQHTETPYRLGTRNGCVVTDSMIEGIPQSTGHLDKEYYGGNLIAESIWKQADAEFIVKACNNHGSLLTACRAALDHLDGCSHGYPDELWNMLETAIKNAE